MSLTRKGSFTLVELIVSVALFMVAITVALYATVGTHGIIARTEARAVVAESSRSVSDAIRRITVNAPVGGIDLVGGLQSGGYPGLRARSFASGESSNICSIIGRALVTVDSTGKELFALDQTGSAMATWIYGVDDAGLCPAPGTSSRLLFQNRLTNRQTKVTSFSTQLLSMNCQSGCSTKEQLRYVLTVEENTALAGRASETRRPSVQISGSVPIGLVDETVGLPNIVTSDLPDGIVETAYSQTLVAGGGTTPYAWTLVSGALPSNLTLSSIGVISGTPQAGTQGTYNITVRVTDDNSKTDDQSLILQVSPVNGGPQLTIITNSPLTNGTVGTAYSATLQGANGSQPYSWSNPGGGLPTGLSLASSTGVISGTPTVANNYSFVIRLTDSQPSFVEKTFNILISAGNQPLTITTTSPLPNATATCAYSQQLSATGGTPGYSWAFDGVLPIQLSWLSISAGGLLTGTPTMAGGPYTFSVQVTDSGTPVPGTQTKSFNLTIDPLLMSCGGTGEEELG
ncbi:hypothetical protein A3A71_00850 [Candidatus Berkelbacteria bacterium RIFCSPLOWO2_01_FULL_50_28]|uniref:Uncharacterized protein n=1 Tax=Candidatus Berkelbacteria bacterium RIFCSPLOWO2_01_FULL_50_28 TaxID=1797471 RepID=A0A1F5EBB7_9BACT|nr:MAG: hypothetical protein A2807_01420 [Candidatus Berkelbacteria bacterium RIFCSPHIGHO2_01_FULL_50_36]OGD62099.1 MAG: hypothetical protein A3F39_03075 [Candidatus Berkelbacteria bacterium RIFCSPHIGHO2_12_FULL_50_11]OGD64590.1 MAG: hypothetical protein A3A71_00850 [Candidatus Berkelbacteria bacterium RIFCSPLOWO2_01_FULL_50_28]